MYLPAWGKNNGKKKKKKACCKTGFFLSGQNRIAKRKEALISIPLLLRTIEL
jgi:hypothetical protein